MRSRISISLCALALSVHASVARAQFNPDGTPSMINPADYHAAPIYQEGADGLPTEDYTVDCDPDIESCVDGGDSQFDDGYDPNAYQQFQSQLAPYGQWNEDPDYGQVWTPSQDVVGADFEPYATDGQWQASSDYGMAWVSDYEWGWAPFHYGRWIIGTWGWMWVPGTLWGPAWVDWRYGNGYCGWAPMPPRGVHVPAPGSSTSGTRPVWHFTLAGEVTRRNPSYVPATVTSSIFKRTTPLRAAHEITLNGVKTKIAIGPSPTQLSHDAGRAVPAMSFRNAAPSQLPRQSIVAKAGMALPQRSYVQRAPRVAGVNAMPRAATTPYPAVQGRVTSTQSGTVREPVRSYNNNNSYVPPSRSAYTNSNSAVPQTRNSYNNQNYAPEHSYSGYTPQQQQPTRESAPAQQYQQPTYYRPAQTYAPPAQTYEAPRQTYAPPAQTYQAPRQTYAPPQQIYQAPQQMYQAPRQTYSAPQPTYQAPVQHAAPAYSAPVQHSAPTFSSPSTTHRR